jgi:hypothetical protein
LVVIAKFYLIIIKTNNESNVAETNVEAFLILLADPDSVGAAVFSDQYSLEKLQTG